jgi:hypothetical protein
LYNPKTPEIFEQPKIFYKNTAKFLTVVYDESEFYALNTLYAIIPKVDSSRETIKSLAALLNSKICDFWYRIIFWGLRIPGRSTKYREVLKFLPLPVSFSNLSEKLDKIIYINSMKKKLENVERYYSATTEINKIILSMSSSHKSISPKIQKEQGETYNIIIGKRKKEKPILVDSEEKAQLVKLSLIGKNVKKGEKIEILVPKSNSDVKETLKEYNEDKKKLNEMPSLEKLEQEINEIVYDLYGLDGDDIDVLEDFLEKF